MSSSELSEFQYFLEHTLELLLNCEDREQAVGGIFDALATAAFRQSYVPTLVDQFKQATLALEQVQQSARYH